MIGESGAVYSRYGQYLTSSNIVDERRLPVIFREEFGMPKESPFGGMNIRFLGENLPVADCGSWTKDTRLLSGNLILSERDRMLAIQSSLTESHSSFQ